MPTSPLIASDRPFAIALKSDSVAVIRYDAVWMPLSVARYTVQVWFSVLAADACAAGVPGVAPKPRRKRALASWVIAPEPSCTRSVGSMTSVESPLCRISTPGASLSITVTSSEFGTVTSRLLPVT